MPDPMRIRATVKDGVADVRVLMAHEMETGQRKDAAGKIVPVWHITEVTASLNGKPVLVAHWGPAVSKNPYLQFKIRGAKAGVAGKLQGHRLPRDDPVVILTPLGEFGDQQGAVRVTHGRLGTGSTKRRPRGEQEA